MFSCSEEETISEVKVDRLFRPVGFSAYVSGVEVKFVWTPIKNATYLMEISKDSLLFENELQSIAIGEEAIDGGSASYTIEDYCWSNTRYSARVKSVSVDPDVDDSGWQEVTFKTGTENIFYSVAAENINTNSILLKWLIGKDVSHIVISATGVDDRMVTLSNDDKNTGEKLIGELNPGTAYTFKIYLSTRLRGTITATTKS
jgi:hypothetical protein